VRGVKMELIMRYNCRSNVQVVTALPSEGAL